MNKLIALYSPAPQSGKSTIANYLASKHGYTVVSFARPLKEMVAALLSYQEMSDEAIHEFVHGARKEQPCVQLGNQTPRYAMQRLGTEWGRDKMGRDFWVEIAIRRIRDYMSAGERVVIDDMRFPNEHDAMAMMGATLVRITRPTAAECSGHSSEGALEGHNFTTTIVNDGTLDQMFLMGDELAKATPTDYIVATMTSALGRDFNAFNTATVSPIDALNRSRYVGGKGAGEPA